MVYAVRSAISMSGPMRLARFSNQGCDWISSMAWTRTSWAWSSTFASRFARDHGQDPADHKQDAYPDQLAHVLFLIAERPRRKGGHDRAARPSPIRADSFETPNDPNP